MEAMAATEVATTVASEDCTTSARGLLVPRLMLNPASTVALEGMEAMAAMVATMVASEDCTTSARGLLRPRLMLNPASLAMEAMAATGVASMVASGDTTVDKLKMLY